VVVFHDILSELEINYLIKKSTPHLSRKRYVSDEQNGLAKHEFGNGKKVKVVQKSGKIECSVKRNVGNIHNQNK
jgi:hypothetical protein